MTQDSTKGIQGEKLGKPAERDMKVLSHRTFDLFLSALIAVIAISWLAKHFHGVPPERLVQFQPLILCFVNLVCLYLPSYPLDCFFLLTQKYGNAKFTYFNIAKKLLAHSALFHQQLRSDSWRQAVFKYTNKNNFFTISQTKDKHLWQI